MIEEAKGWNKVKAQSDDNNRSESGGSDSNAAFSSTESSKSGEFSGMFRFSPEDTILVVDDSMCPIIPVTIPPAQYFFLRLGRQKVPSVDVRAVMLWGFGRL